MVRSEAIRTAVFGGQGYVAGEVLRLLAQHPRFEVAAVFSTSQGGEPLVASFPNLVGTPLDGLTFTPQDAFEQVIAGREPIAVFFATPHGATAALADRVLAVAARTKTPVKAVDLSADFRLGADDYARLYGHPHGAPGRLAEFLCAVPEHVKGKPPAHVAHPGCFTTATVVAAFPFFALDLVLPLVRVSAITGSSGSGRSPAPNTHHPERDGNLYAYNPLGHRHEQEMIDLLSAARAGTRPMVEFVPHSGPFVRGIHATLFLDLKQPAKAAELVEKVNAFYGPRSFVHATTAAPKLTEVVGTNRLRLGVAVRDRALVVTSVVDNLTKGAAGGAVQWMNRLFDLDEDTGLRAPGLFPAP